MADNVSELAEILAARAAEQGNIRRMLDMTYTHGFNAGELVGSNAVRTEMQGKIDKAIGLGLLVGVGVGVVLAVAVGGLL